MQRSGSAIWRGSGLEGSGVLTTTSGALSNQPYSTKMRFQDEEGRTGTNPEELLAAAHAGCFSMKLSFLLTNAGHAPEELKTESVITMDKQGTEWSLTRIVLKLDARVPGMTDETFHQLAANAKETCPVSRALSVPIELQARLHQ